LCPIQRPFDPFYPRPKKIKIMPGSSTTTFEHQFFPVERRFICGHRENLADWQAKYESTWLAHWQKTGETKWDIYPRPTNKTAPGGPGIDLTRSRLALISTAGGYLPASQSAL
jgi:hypothetical protein